MLVNECSGRLQRRVVQLRCAEVALMTALGTSLMVLGMALLCSGLVFVLPTGRTHSLPQESFEESPERTAYYLQQVPEGRDEL